MIWMDLNIFCFDISHVEHFHKQWSCHRWQVIWNLVHNCNVLLYVPECYIGSFSVGMSWICHILGQIWYKISEWLSMMTLEDKVREEQMLLHARSVYGLVLMVIGWMCFMIRVWWTEFTFFIASSCRQLYDLCLEWWTFLMCVTCENFL